MTKVEVKRVLLVTDFSDTAQAALEWVVPFIDSVAGTPVYLNPSYVVAVRPDPADPDHVSIVKVRDGETIRVRGDHQQVADKLTRAA